MKTKNRIRQLSSGSYISDNQLKKMIDEQVQESYKQIFDDGYKQAVKDVIPQIMAYSLKSLQVTYSFGEKRLKKYLETFQELNNFCESGILGKQITPDNIIKDLKQNYNIDVQDVSEINFVGGEKE